MFEYFCIFNIRVWEIMDNVINVVLCKLWWYISVWSKKWMCNCNNDDKELFDFDFEGILYVRKNKYDMLLDVEIVFEI